MSAFLLDTNVISETVRPRPEPRVLSWFRERTPRDLFLSAVTLGELVRGALSVGDPARSLRYQQWITRDLTRQFGGRILAFDDRAAVIWGEIMGAADKPGDRGQPWMPRSRRSHYATTWFWLPGTRGTSRTWNSRW